MDVNNENKNNVNSENANKVAPSNEIIENKSFDNEKSKKNGNDGIIIFFLLLLAIGGGVFFILNKDMFKGKEKPQNIETKPNPVLSINGMSGNSLDNFDLSFMKYETNNQNMVYSPLSIKYALAMLRDGSANVSKEQIDALIGDYKFKKYTNSKNLSLGNSLFIRDTFKNNVKDTYITSLKDKYNAEVIYDEFKSADKINRWVSNKTFGLVNNIVTDDQISQNNFSLVNALAIDMEWKNVIQAVSSEEAYSVFYPHENYDAYVPETNGEDFDSIKFNNSKNVKAAEIGVSANNYDIITTLGEDNIRKEITKKYTEWVNDDEVDQSCKIGNESGTIDPVEEVVDKYVKELKTNYKQVLSSTDFRFYIDSNIKVFAKELKEYDGATLEYVGIMPISKSLKEFVNDNDATSLNNIISKLKTIELDSFEKGKITKIVGGIPLFNFDYELELMDNLKTLGITDVFNQEKANLSNMVNGKAFIDNASHKANIVFSNDGIKAGAATSLGGRGSADCSFDYLYEVPVVEIDLSFDKPYLFLIRDKNSGEVWFMGNVYELDENLYENATIINEKSDY